MISVAVQRGSMVYVYDEKNKQIMLKSGQLYGYTGGSVPIKVGSMLYTFDEKGRTISSKPA